VARDSAHESNHNDRSSEKVQANQKAEKVKLVKKVLSSVSKEALGASSGS